LNIISWGERQEFIIFVNTTLNTVCTSLDIWYNNGKYTTAAENMLVRMRRTNIQNGPPLLPAPDATFYSMWMLYI
jgi:hypothetical protein